MPKSQEKLRRKAFNLDGSSSTTVDPNKKLASDDTFVDKLMKKADSLVETFEYDLARQFYKRVLDYEPDHLQAVESLANIDLQMGNVEGAEKYLLKAVKISPNNGFRKYFALGQISSGQDSLNYYEKGIQTLKSEDGWSTLGAVSSPLGDSEAEKQLDLSNAYCAMAEIYMTDLCDEEDAESQCRSCIDNAIATNESNPEVYQCLASYQLVKEELEDARQSIEKSLSLWLPKHRISREQSNDTCPLTYEFRINTSKILIELNMFDEAAEVLGGLVEEDDEVVYVWYMLGLLNYLRGSDYFGNARFYFKKALKVCKKLDQLVEHQSQISHTEQLLEEVGPGSDSEDEEENGMDKDDEEYETVSEEEEMES